VPPGRQQVSPEQLFEPVHEKLEQMQLPPEQDCPGEQATQALPFSPQSLNVLVEVMHVLVVVSQQPEQLESQVQTCVPMLQL